jgi:hypothetical protein
MDYLLSVTREAAPGLNWAEWEALPETPIDKAYACRA